MASILSQDEVDSLLEGISEGKVQTETDVPEIDERVKTYDFRSQAGPIHQKMPALGRINERFMGLLRTSLSRATRLVVDVNLASTETLEFGEFCRSLSLPTSLSIFKMEPLRGFALMVLEGPLVFSFVDTYFGGRGVSHVKLEGRGFTTVETKIIERVTKIILNELQQAWADTHPLRMAYSRTEMDPQFAAIVTLKEMVIVVRLTVDLETTSGSIILCIPCSTLEPIRQKLKQNLQGEKPEIDPTWINHMEKKIKGLTVNLTATLGKARINGRELLGMKANDVIVLDQKIGEPIGISVEGVPKLKGYIGSCKNKKAVKISAIFTKE